MKIIMIFFSVFISSSTCGTHNQKQEFVFKVVYKGQTRGSNLEYTINNTNITAITNGFDGKNGEVALQA
ncbi:MAG: hypothetical protein KJO63_15600, partial [Maribacter sp.]|nr:hypothetical protein [Maribacter sp.]